MKAVKLSILMLCTSFQMQACSNGQTKDPASPDYLIFGSYAGECVGDCATLFKVEGEKLYIDTIEYPRGVNSRGRPNPVEITFNQTALTQEYYDIAEKVLNNFPDELHELESQTFGCPDCDDRGAIYLEIKFQGTRKIWTIDTSERFSEPSFMVSYRYDLAEAFKDISAIQ